MSVLLLLFFSMFKFISSTISQQNTHFKMYTETSKRKEVSEKGKASKALQRRFELLKRQCFPCVSNDEAVTTFSRKLYNLHFNSNSWC